MFHSPTALRRFPKTLLCSISMYILVKTKDHFHRTKHQTNQALKARIMHLSTMSDSKMVLFIVSLFLLSSLSHNIAVIANENFYQDVDITWGNGRAMILKHGKLLTLSLDQASGSGFQSKNEFIYGKFDMKIKLVPGNSAGVVTAYYVSSISFSIFATDTFKL